jgi:hypothetical protein
MKVTWTKCETDVWCNFDNLNLNHQSLIAVKGVYVIWHGGQSSNVVRVGQGVIADRMRVHRLDSPIQRYRSLSLFVTWCRLADEYLDGVEAYLAQALQPLVGERFPNVRPIQVNLPR